MAQLSIGKLLNRVHPSIVRRFVAESAAKEAGENGLADLSEVLSEHGYKIIECE